MQITKELALNAVAQRTNNNYITVSDIEKLLLQTRGVTFASVQQVTEVKTAAKHKHETIHKVTFANVTLANNLKQFTNLYENKVKSSSAKIEGNDNSAIDSFKSHGSWFHHTPCYSIVKHNTKDQFYMFALYNSSSCVYIHNGLVVEKEYVAQFLTPSAAKALLDNKETVTNVKYGIEHTAIVRTVALSSIVKITANKKSVTI